MSLRTEIHRQVREEGLWKVEDETSSSVTFISEKEKGLDSVNKIMTSLRKLKNDRGGNVSLSAELETDNVLLVVRW